MIFRYAIRSLTLTLITIFSIGGCNNTQQQGLPLDPDDWVCQSSLASATQTEIDEWCENNPDRGKPLPDILRSPFPIYNLTDKNIYDIVFSEFIIERVFDNDLGWIGDAEWRFTGPYVGEIGTGDNYGTHLAIRIFYSPEIIDWLCDNRAGSIPDGAVIVKEMHTIDDDLGVELDDEGCMIVPEDVEPNGWTVIVKQNDASFDGWYWGIHISDTDPDFFLTMGNPPVFGRSGITTLDFFEDGFPPTEPNSNWYPTGTDFTNPDHLISVTFPINSYAAPCMQCHAAAISEYTFSSLDNVLGMSIRYKQFSKNKTGIEVPEFIPNAALHLPIFESFVNQTTLQELEEVVSTELTTALDDPDEDFLEFYDQLDQVNFSEVWETRLPAETYDHVFPEVDGPPQFITSDQCWSCHDADDLLASQANMVLAVDENDSFELLNLSPYSEWKSSPMGQAGRDPIFYSQLQSETNNLPDLKTCVENTCLHCHGVMGQRQLAIDTEGQNTEGCEELFGIAPPPEVPFGKPFTLDMVKQWPDSEDTEFQVYGALARDGVSCTVCHHISQTDLGEEETYTGNFVTGPGDEIYGPYQQVSVLPMQQALGITPQFGSQVSDSGLCGSCHAILLPVFDNDGEQIGSSYEQTTYLEWENSVYSQPSSDFMSCQDCHMPTDFEGGELSFKIANFESNEFPATTNRIPADQNTITERDRFPRHSLHGLNIFLNQITQQFPIILGIRQTDPLGSASNTESQITTQNSMIYMAQNQTAEVEIKELFVNEEGALEAVIEVTNLTGHYLPSGVGFRRMFLEFLVRDSDGNTLWASGRTNDLGVIVEGNTEIVLPSEEPVKFPNIPFQPHYQEITRQDQVQIYQELVKDSAGELTTSFLRRVTEVKDNRIRPKGYDPKYFAMQSSEFIQALAVTVGQAALDPYYTDPELTGADVISYRVSLEEVPLEQIHDVKVTLYNQSIPPFYLQERFKDAKVGPAEKDEIDRLYYIASHLDVEEVTDDNGNAVLDDWKFYITSETREFQ